MQDALQSTMQLQKQHDREALQLLAHGTCLSRATMLT